MENLSNREELLQKIDTNKTRIIKSSGYNRQTDLNTKNKQLNHTEKYWAILASVNKNPVEIPSGLSIFYESPYFYVENNREVGLSRFFYVQLKNEDDLSALIQMAKDNNVIIEGQFHFRPLWYTLFCTRDSKGNAMEMANRFYESGLFGSAQPDFIMDNLLLCTNDYYFYDQWGLDNIDPYYLGYEGLDINICEAWELSTGSNVIVAVVDMGVQLNHPDLTVNIHPLSYDAQNATIGSQVYGPHGTACAGIIGAEADNGIGVAGIAHDCKLMSISHALSAFQGDPEKQPEKMADGIDFARINGADVMSNSWFFSTEYEAIDEAIEDALSLGRNGLGCVMVFAAGNDNLNNVVYPADSHPDILAVGAMSPCGERKSGSSCDTESWGSNWGPELDIVAPGVLIPTTDSTGDSEYNSKFFIHEEKGGALITNDYYNLDYTRCFSGTSSATPHVSGVAALVLSANPNLTQKQVANIIESTAQKVRPDKYNYHIETGRPNGTRHDEMGYGLVDAYCAVLNAQPLSLTGTLPSNSHKRYYVNMTNATINSGSNINITTAELNISGTFNANSGSTLSIENTNSIQCE